MCVFKNRRRGPPCELFTRLELVTSSLPRKCSTTELKQQFFLSLSGRRGSNPRPPAWKASALSTELLPQTALWGCGQRWIRTTEGESQQIYSLPHLSTLVFALAHPPLSEPFQTPRCAFAGAKVGINRYWQNFSRFFLLFHGFFRCVGVFRLSPNGNFVPFLYACRRRRTPLFARAYI